MNNEKMRELMERAMAELGDAPEISPGNYSDDEVLKLNNAANQAYNILDAALTQQPENAWNPLTDCCCGESDETWRICPQHGPDAAQQPESVPDDCTADNLADDVAVRIDAMLGVDADYFDCVVCGEPVDLSDMGNCGDCGGVFHWMECGEWGGRRHQCTECREEEDEEAEFGTKTCPGGNPAALERPTGEN